MRYSGEEAMKSKPGLSFEFWKLSIPKRKPHPLPATLPPILIPLMLDLRETAFFWGRGFCSWGNNFINLIMVTLKYFYYFLL